MTILGTIIIFTIVDKVRTLTNGSGNLSAPIVARCSEEKLAMANAKKQAVQR